MILVLLLAIKYIYRVFDLFNTYNIFFNIINQFTYNLKFIQSNFEFLKINIFFVAILTFKTAPSNMADFGS